MLTILLLVLGSLGTPMNGNLTLFRRRSIIPSIDVPVVPLDSCVEAFLLDNLRSVTSSTILVRTKANILPNAKGK